MKTHKRTCEVAIHFNNSQHNLSGLEFIVIEQVYKNSSKYNLDELLLTREAYWQAQLCTNQPYGLNKGNEFNSMNRIAYNT